MAEITTIGLDIAKSVFQVHGVDAAGQVVVRRQLRRSHVLRYFAGLAPCVAGVEACATSHYWSRQLQALGHIVKLMPPSYVKPYVKRQKNDMADAEAICEAVMRPTMRFVETKTPEQQSVLMLNRSPDSRWRMFTLGAPNGGFVNGRLVPPGAVAVEDGPALEEVPFLRDEMANLAWAVERVVQGPSGVGRERNRKRDDPRPPAPGPVDTAQLDYLLQTRVPARWTPYVPRSSGYRAVELVQGRMSDRFGAAVPPIGRLLNRDDLQVLKSAELPREGVLVRRQPSLTRRADGAYVRWTTRRVLVGKGEGSSRLAFDAAIPRRPRPNT